MAELERFKNRVRCLRFTAADMHIEDGQRKLNCPSSMVEHDGFKLLGSFDIQNYQVDPLISAIATRPD